MGSPDPLGTPATHELSWLLRRRDSHGLSAAACRCGLGCGCTRGARGGLAGGAVRAVVWQRGLVGVGRRLAFAPVVAGRLGATGRALAAGVDACVAERRLRLARQ